MRTKYLFFFFLLIIVFSCNNTPTMPPKALPIFDWQGHRGSRGLMPENTIPAFLKALEFNVRTLEMDAAISQDGKVIISHEPWFSHEIATTPDGKEISDEMEKNYLIHQMSANDVKAFDVGSRGNARFPQQKKMQAHKPTLEEVVKAVNKYCKKHNQELPYYNIEIKSKPEWDVKLAPIPAKFAKILLEEVKRLGIHEKTCIQSFDTRSLLAVNEIDKTIMTAYLIENINPFEENMAKLDFIPTIYSPYYQLVTDTLSQEVHTKGMNLIPWTINDVETMQKMIHLKVDGIITDYPNLISEIKN